MAKDKGNPVFRAVMKGLRDRTPTESERQADADSTARIERERKRLEGIAARDRREEAQRQAAEQAHLDGEAERRRQQ